MDGLISSSSIPKPMSTSYLQNVMTKCIESWFDRYRHTEPVKTCNDNECVVLRRFSDFEYVNSFHECGLLCWIKRDWVDVSCDVIVYIGVPRSDIFNVHVEVKTRYVEATINKSEAVFKK